MRRSPCVCVRATCVRNVCVREVCVVCVCVRVCVRITNNHHQYLSFPSHVPNPTSLQMPPPPPGGAFWLACLPFFLQSCGACGLRCQVHVDIGHSVRCAKRRRPTHQKERDRAFGLEPRHKPKPPALSDQSSISLSLPLVVRLRLLKSKRALLVAEIILSGAGAT